MGKTEVGYRGRQIVGFLQETYHTMRTPLNGSLLPKQPTVSRKFFRFFLLGIFLCLAVTGGFSFGSLQGSDDKNAEPPVVINADEKPVAKPALNGNGSHEYAKLIPDFKTYFGSPDTVINLNEIFAGTEIAKQGGDLTWKVIRNSKTDDKTGEPKYVDAKINGSNLILTWKKIGKTEIRIRATNENGDVVNSKFQAEVWKADYWKLVMTVIGGLGIFLLGMKSMSDGLQAVAGQGLRRMISLVTDNRFLATGVGTLVTMIVQSSSITTVMVVGFVNSGFMTLSQAIGVIMGANIGTTITGWILVIKIGKYGLPMLGVCVFIYLFVTQDRLRFLALFGMGLGMIFFGLETMKNGFTIVKDLPEFEAWFNTFSAETYFGVLKCALVGCVLTFVVQSSSATLGITIALADTGVIGFPTAAALVLGENIGTTITAWLASFGTTTNAKRAAYFHMLFNILGVIWITAIFRWYLPVVANIVGLNIDTKMNVIGNADSTSGIAACHTGFNVVNMLIFLPFTAMIANFLIKIVPDKAVKEKPHLTSLDVRMLETPAIAIEQSRVVILGMAHDCEKMMDWLRELSTSEEPDPKLVQKLFHREEVLDTIQDEVVAFMTNLLSANVPHTIVSEGRCQLRMADEYESISDYITSILKFQLKLRDQGHRFDDKHLKEILELHNRVNDYLKLVNEGFEFRNPEVITKANSMGSEITHLAKSLRDQHLEDLSEKKMEPFVNIAYTSTLNSYRRVRDHAKNVAEALAGGK
jgi:phosphate:Na+ symporter